MASESVNRSSGRALAVLAGFALLLVVIGYVTHPKPEADEGTLAHLFQLTIVALVPVGLVFLASADWTQPARIVRRLSLPAVAVTLAFAALYYLEHVYQPAHR